MNSKNYYDYKILQNRKYEIIDTNDKTMKKIYSESAKYYDLQEFSCIKADVIPLNMLGQTAFYILANIESLYLDTKIKNKLTILKEYVLKCINDISLLNEKIFLSFLHISLGITFLPSSILSGIYDNSKNYDFNILSNNEILNLLSNNENSIKIDKIYTCNNIIDIVVCSLYEIILSKNEIKICRGCNKFFLCNNSSCFCNYKSPYNKNLTCLEYSRNTNYVEKRKNDPIQYTYTKISNLLRKRWYDSRDNKLVSKETTEDFRKKLDAFKEEYRLKILDLNTGKISKSYLLSWLNEKYLFYRGDCKNGNRRNNKK